MPTTPLRAGTEPAVFDGSSVIDAMHHLELILDGLAPGSPFDAGHPDVRELVDAGQLPSSLLGTLFSALHRAGRIKRTDWHPMSHGHRNGGSAHVWVVVA